MVTYESFPAKSKAITNMHGDVARKRRGRSPTPNPYQPAGSRSGKQQTSDASEERAESERSEELVEATDKQDNENEFQNQATNETDEANTIAAARPGIIRWNFCTHTYGKKNMTNLCQTQVDSIKNGQFQLNEGIKFTWSFIGHFGWLEIRLSDYVERFAR